jgi:aryl-alcohol dehydrogenase-like predicted oxidoreductase
MQHQPIGDTGLYASRICLGSGDFGSGVTAEATFAILDAFVEGGGNFLDTARVYAAWVPGGMGVSERTIGAWLRSRGVRGRMIIGTKGAHPPMEDLGIARMSPDDIASDLADSLEALGVEAVDLYWLHRDAPGVPVDEIVDALDVQAAAGRIRAIGASNWTTERIAEANAYARSHGKAGFCASQIAWSLAALPAEDKAMRTYAMDAPTYAYHARTGLPVIPYSAQARGFFGGKYGPGRGDPNSPVVKNYYNAENFDRLARAQALAAQLGRSANEVALAYLLSQPFPVFPIVGPHSVEQLRASLAAADLTLTPDQVAYLEGR